MAPAIPVECIGAHNYERPGIDGIYLLIRLPRVIYYDVQVKTRTKRTNYVTSNEHKDKIFFNKLMNIKILKLFEIK